MKRIHVFVIVTMLCSGQSVFAGDLPPASGGAINTNTYHLAYVDVKDAAHNYETGKEPGGDESTLREWVWKQLEGLQIESTLDDDTNAGLHVICRFEHKLMMPVITQGAQIKMSSIGKCSIKIVDKKTEKVLIEKSWVRNKKNGKLPDFIKTVFAEWKAQHEKEAASHAQTGTDAKTTNSVPLPPPQKIKATNSEANK